MLEESTGGACCVCVKHGEDVVDREHVDPSLCFGGQVVLLRPLR